GTLDINRRPIIIEPDPDPDPDPDPVPELRRVKTEKEADREAAAVGDVITYKITVTNIGSVELKDIPVRDTNDGSGRITAAGGPGYTWHEDSGTWTIHRLPVGKSITITYTYEVVEADDGKDITNVAVTTVPGTNPEDPDNPGHGIDPEKPIDPDTEYPSDEVVVPVDPDREPDPDPDPVDGRSITIVKFTDTAFAAVGDTIGYGATVTNNGTVDLTNIRLEDIFANASGPITPVEGDGYVWEGGDALIPELAVGESVTVYFDYTVQADDAGKNLRNVVIASVPGENPPDPDAPDTGVNDPDAPVTPDVEYPSNEVVVPVDPAGGGVAADPKVKIYGDDDPELTYTLTEELIKPDDIWGELERVPGEAVGVYPILQGTLESKNYDITYIPAIFRILPAPLTATAQDKTKVYGDANPTLTYTVTGFKFNETLENATDNNVTVETPATLESGVGEYAIKASGLTFPANGQGNRNYYAVYVDGTLRITPALLTVTAENKQKIYTDPNPELTYTVTGWKLDDTLENATNTDVQLDTPVGLYTLVGEYPITPSGLTFPLNAQGKVNYDVQYVPGVFRVLPIAGLIDVFAPEAEAIVRGPDGNILTVT
ncbi:MBG domain-containing protein, partial [Ruthenibacterium lactatiformans]|uniref:MBG domain-containing protein n=1 Tax=Ruthenibacterium lactatiformans TaxID=1550024 RepID=UPI00196741B5